MNKKYIGFLKNYEKELQNVKDEEFASYIYNNILRVDDNISVNVRNNYTNEVDTHILTAKDHELGFLSQVWDKLSPENKGKLIYWQTNKLAEENNLPTINKQFINDYNNVASYNMNEIIKFNIFLLIEKNTSQYSLGPSVYSTIVHEMKHYYDQYCLTHKMVDTDKKNFLAKYSEFIKTTYDGQQLTGGSFFDSSEKNIDYLTSFYAKTELDKQIVRFLLNNTYTNFPMESVAFSLQNIAIENLIKTNHKYTTKQDIDSVNKKKQYAKYYNCEVEENKKLYELNFECSYYNIALFSLKVLKNLIKFENEESIIKQIPEIYLKAFSFPNVIDNLSKSFEAIFNEKDYKKMQGLTDRIQTTNDQSTAISFIEYKITELGKKLKSRSKQFSAELKKQFDYNKLMYCDEQPQ